MSSEVTRILSAIAGGDRAATEQLLPIVYDELRALARARLAREAPGQTLQPTALVHEVYLRLIGDGPSPQWDGRAHFFGAAAEAMRRILVDNARHRQRLRHGGGLERVELAEDLLPLESAIDEAELIALSDALDDLARTDPRAAEVVKHRYFAGLGVEETAAILEISERTVARSWEFARTWLFRKLNDDPLPSA